jgi:O-antigen/teichoic acid export membrane protein
MEIIIMIIESRTKNASRNAIWGIVNKICTMIFPFILRTLMIKILGSEYLGLNGLFTSILEVLSLAELGISSAIVFSMYKLIAEKNIEAICAYFNLYRKIYRFIGCIILLCGLFLMPILPRLISGEIPMDINLYVIYLICLFNTVISYFLFAYKECLLTAHQRSDISSNISTLIYIVMYIVQIILLLVFKNYYIYVICTPISTVAINLLRAHKVDKMYPQYVCKGNIGKRALRDLYKRVGGLIIYRVSGVFRTSFDSIIISAFLGLTVLAKYQNYYFIMSSISLLLTIITSSMTAGIGNSIATESIGKNYQDIKKVYFLINWISGWFAICLLCLYQPFMRIWLGEYYLFSMNVVLLMIVYFYSLKVNEVSYIYRQAVGLWWEDKARAMSEAAVNLILNILVVKYYGVVGVIVSTIVTIVFINIPWGTAILFKNYFKTSPLNYFMGMLKNAMVVCITGAVTYFICSLLPSKGIIPFIEKMLICCIVPNLVFIIIYFRTSEFDNAIHIVKRLMSFYTTKRGVVNEE